MKEYKSFYKVVGGNEGDKCRYPTRLDTYGCGCAHNCSYCYARSLLEFRGLWDPNNPRVASISKIESKIKSLRPNSVVRLGGMTDCFQPCELEHRVTYEAIKLLNLYHIHYLIVTKSDMVASDEYMKILNPELAHIQVTVTSTDDAKSLTYENACLPSRRINAIETLAQSGFDTQLRLSPFIPHNICFEALNRVKCNKIIVEFMRVNRQIEKLFNMDFLLYTHSENGYRHLPLEEKVNLLNNITNFRDISVCEDCTDHYEYWKTHVNPNALDCCNLRF